MKVKIMIFDGVIEEVLTDEYMDIEIANVDSEEENYDAAYEYMERLRKDPTLKRQDYTATRFPQIWLDPAMPPDSESTQN